MRKPPAMGVRAILAVATVFAATACLDEQAIYDDDPFPSDPPSAAQGFLGYADTEAQLTVCGNCHEALHHEWLETAHANAWESGGSVDPACQGCHSVNERGNVIAEPAGYLATEHERYQDVQCESCHGPGLEHVLDPSRSNAPYPSVEEGLTLTTGCGECHRGNEQPYLEELFASRHGMINVFPANQEGTCDQCHTGEGAINRLGISFKNFDPADYQGKDNHMGMACLICHDPHAERGGDAMLRFPVNSQNLEANLCTQCHNERGNPDPMNERQPHAPAGPLLLGTAGYWPPAAPRDRIVGSHGDPDVNEGLCASCHMYTFDASGGYETTGHLFVATPCLDSSGRPLISDDCASDEREFGSCATSGCHSDEAGARSAQAAARARLTSLAVELRALLEDVPRSEFDDTDLGVTVAEGARFNAQLSDRRGSEVHNPALLEVLLLGSIESVEETYGLQASAALVRTPFFDLH